MIAALWGRVAPYVIGAGALLAAIVTFGRSQRRAGAAAERTTTVLKNAEIKDAQLHAAARRPADRDALRQRLRDGSF